MYFLYAEIFLKHVCVYGCYVVEIFAGPRGPQNIAGGLEL